MKKDAISADVQPVAVDLGLHQARGQIVVVVDAAILRQRAGVGADVHRNLNELFEIRRQIGVAEPENHVGPVEYPLMVFLGNPHHVADDLQRQRPGELADQIGLSVGMIGDQRCDQPVGPLAHRRLDAGHHLRGERPADDRAQPLVSRIVEHDHRAEVLGHLRCLVVDRDVGAGAEYVRMTAGVVHIVQLGQRPISVAGRKPLVLDRGPERDRGLAAQGGESTVANVVVAAPRTPATRDGCRQVGSRAVVPRLLESRYLS